MLKGTLSINGWRLVRAISPGIHSNPNHPKARKLFSFFTIRECAFKKTLESNFQLVSFCKSPKHTRGVS